ncbi:MAG: hypothetical protein K6C14_05260, partial [Eubacterium sp.]|nr:hypothetical protein [Eubacterium sp.]
RIQFVINGLFFVAYIALSVSGIERGGLFGFAVGVLIANALRMLLTFVIGLIALKKQGRECGGETE